MAVAVDLPALVDFDALGCLAIRHGPNGQVAPPSHLVDGNLLFIKCTPGVPYLGTNAQWVAPGLWSG